MTCLSICTDGDTMWTGAAYSPVQLTEQAQVGLGLWTDWVVLS